MKKSIIYFSIVLLVVSLGLTLVPPTFGQTEQNTFGQTEQNVKILNYSYYFDTDGYLEVVGQVQNVGSNTLDPVYLTGSVLSASGTDLSDSYCTLLVADLIPQEIAPFNMEFMPLNWGPLDISSIVINVGQANVTSSYQYTDLKITSSSATIGTSGNLSGAYLVNGVIQNTGSQTAQNVSMVATFYNTSGTVIAIGYNTVFLTYSLAPSATIPFQVPAYDLNQSAVPASEKISSYSLLIQDQGPILQGTPPVFTSNPNAQGSVTQTGGSSPTSSPTSSLTPTKPTGNATANSLNPILIVLIVVVIAIVAAMGTIVALRRIKPKDNKTKA
jgi:hypothetical protein